MNADISPESEQFIQSVIASGVYQTRGEVLDDALQLLKRRRHLLEHVDEGTRQLRSGDFTEYDDEGLRKFFADVQTR
jgi:putative addiction module CopG family antidote